MKIIKPVAVLFLMTCALFSNKASAQEVPVLDWVTSVGGMGQTFVRDMYRDPSGNFYVTGDFFGPVDFDPGAGVTTITSPSNNDVFIAKYDPNGVFQWVRQMGGPSSIYGYGVVADALGNVYTTGWFNNTVDFDPGAGTFNVVAASGSGYYDVYISKLDANGNFVWAKSIGASDGDLSYSIDLDASGNVYVGGVFAYTVDFDPGPGVFNMTAGDYSGMFILKLDKDGNFVWARKVDGTYTQELFNVAIDATGNVYATGTMYGDIPVDFDPGAGVFNLTPDQDALFILKLDASGTFVWAKLIDGQAGEDIAFDASGNVYVTGKFYGTTDFDPNAGVFNLTSVSQGDIFVLKLTSAGDFVWVKQMGGSGHTNFSGNENRGLGITIDASGNVLSTGRFAGTGDFDPGAGTFTMSAGNNSHTNGYISKLDKDGNFIWATGFGGVNNYDIGYRIFTGASGVIYAFGQYQGTCDFDPSACTYNVTGQWAGYIWKLNLGTAIPSPTITSFTPDVGPIGTVVTITGTNFSSVAANNEVRFTNNRLATISASSTTSITATVPASTITGKISVTSNCMTVQSANNFTIGVSVTPTITSFTPASGLVGATVTITGTNFSTTPANNIVKFNGTTAVVTSSTATSIVTTVPFGATTGTITVTVGANTGTSANTFTVTTPAPSITSFTPASGPISTAVTITGTNFSTTAANNVVAFNGTAAIVTASTATSIATSLPANATTGKITVTVSGNTATSATDFTVTTVQNPPSNQPPVIASTTASAPINGVVSVKLLALLSDPDNNLDPTSLRLLSNTSEKGASAQIIQATSELKLDYGGVPFAGVDRVSIEVCDMLDACAQQSISITVSGEMSVYNAISPNGDGKNEAFHIANIETLGATNSVTIYNRWGDLVWEGANYNNTTVAFTGKNTSGNELASGTYYYKIKVGSNVTNGFLVLKR